MTALALALICLICLLLALIGFVLILAFVNSAQINAMTDMTGDAIYPDHRDHIGEPRP